LDLVITRTVLSFVFALMASLVNFVMLNTTSVQQTRAKMAARVITIPDLTPVNVLKDFVDRTAKWMKMSVKLSLVKTMVLV
jgi:hypothetical protein